MQILIDEQVLRNELRGAKIDPAHFFKRCLERVLLKARPHVSTKLTERFKSIRKQTLPNMEEARELIYEMYLNSPSNEEEIIYLYFITISDDPIGEFLESQNLEMNSLARMVVIELSKIKNKTF